MNSMNNLKKIREIRGLSRAQLAQIVGVYIRYIGLIEEGRRTPSLKVSIALAKALRVSVEDIFLPEKCTICTMIDGANERAVQTRDTAIST